jgi:glycine cleavage system transcriptional repressor
MDELGLFISVDELSEDQLRDTGVFGGAPYVISVIGTDKPGIVYRLSKLLAARGVNITDMKTKVIEGESSPVYTMIMEVAIPKGVKISALKRELSMLGREMNIEVNLREVEFLEL